MTTHRRVATVDLVRQTDNKEVSVRRLAVLLFLFVLALPTAAAAWTWPVDGDVLRPFSFDPAHPYAAGQHRGLEIAAPERAAVRAPAEGTVTFVGTVPGGGKTVSLETPGGYTATLLHLGTIGVGRGDRVAEGAAVATAGDEGFVYFGLRTTSKPQGYVDPLAFLPTRTAEPQPRPAASDVPASGAASGVAPALPAPAAAAPALPSSTADAPARPAVAAATATPSVAASAPAQPASAAPATAPAATGVSSSAVGRAQRATLTASSTGHAADAGAGAGSAAPSANAAVPEGSAVSRAPIHVAAQPSLDIAVAPLPAIDAADDSVARTSASGGRAGGADVQTRRSPRAATGASSASAASGVVATSPVRAPRTAIETPGSSAAARSPLAPVLALLAIAVSVAGALFALIRRRRRGERRPARIIGADVATGTHLGLAEDSRRSGLAVCERPSASRPRGGVRGPGRHLRALPPPEGRRRDDGQRDRRARDAGDGVRRPGRRLAA
ncbi:MAG: M23 family metallopeptidase [Actinobacteria bacterium]|nr:MAG: M23 family metallopeptidase [Actinomycetota bacterium]